MKSGLTFNIIKILVIYALACAIIVYNMLGKLLFNLGTTQLDHSGDGFKNYFSFAYQYRYGEGLWFEGMQYPYGDLITYADGQPALVALFNGLSVIGLDITDHELLVVQSLPFLSILGACFFLHKIMSHYKLPDWWTIISVTACVALSPQLFRMNSHYALAYLFFIPMVWYLCMIHLEKNLSDLKFVLITSTSTLIMGYIHPYMMLVPAVFLISIFLSRIILFRNFKWTLPISAVIPAVLFLASSNMLDPFTTRVANPFGIWEYKTEVSDLLPFYGWFPKLFSFLPGLRSHYHEGYAYVGILGFLLPWMTILLLKKKIKAEKSLSTFLIASLICLLFAMGIHILLTGGYIIEILPPIKQFRSLGRFAWAFYYPIFILSSVLFYRMLEKIDSTRLRSILLALVGIIWIADAYAYTRSFNKHIQVYTSENLLKNDTRLLDALNERRIDSNNFQAVLALPVPVEGAEKFSIHDNWFVKMLAIPYVFQTETPMIGAYMSRTDLGNMLKQAQAGSSFFIKKDIVGDLKDNRDLLVLIAKTDTTLYSDFIQKSYPIAELDDVIVCGISKSSLNEQITIDSLQENRMGILFYRNYEEEVENALLSKGSNLVDGNISLAEIEIEEGNKDTLTFSIWYMIQESDSSVPFLDISFINDKSEVISKTDYRDSDIKRIEVIGNWIQLKKDISLPSSTNSIVWNIKANNLFVDHALISYKGADFTLPLEDDHFIYRHYIVEKK